MYERNGFVEIYRCQGLTTVDKVTFCPCRCFHLQATCQKSVGENTNRGGNMLNVLNIRSV